MSKDGVRKVELREDSGTEEELRKTLVDSMPHGMKKSTILFSI